jgi:transposase
MDPLWRARSDSANAYGDIPRSLRARGRPHCGDHRHAGCESDRKRGVSIDPIGYDAGKKIKGIKRNALVDTEGHLLSLEVIPGNIQDRDCAASLIERALQKYPRLKKIFADGGYAGPKLASQLVGLPVKLEIVKRTDKEGGFKVLRRRWVIERTFSWLRRNRRLMAHYEALAMSAIGFAKLALIGVMLKRLTEVAP